MRWFWLESELVFMLSSDSLRKQNKTTKFFKFHKSFKITLQVPQNILWNKTRGFTLGKEINPSKHRASLPNFHRSYFNYFLLSLFTCFYNVVMAVSTYEIRCFCFVFSEERQLNLACKLAKWLLREFQELVPCLTLPLTCFTHDTRKVKDWLTLWYRARARRQVIFSVVLFSFQVDG